MTGVRVVLVTAGGPGGQVDVGVRSDATPAELAMALGSVIGVGLSGAVAEHHAPPRPGVPLGRRVRLPVDLSLADSGVADGDMIIFRKSAGPAPARPAPGWPAGDAAHRRAAPDESEVRSRMRAESDEPDDRN
jgi:hypothetical protein